MKGEADVAQVAQSKERIARVVRVVRDEHPYAVAAADGISAAVTFSLDPNHHVWEEPTYPIQGERVILSDIRKNDKGWRAHKARFLRPEDEALQQP